jgi:hypothetical protein
MYKSQSSLYAHLLQHRQTMPLQTNLASPLRGTDNELEHRLRNPIWFTWGALLLTSTRGSVVSDIFPVHRCYLVLHPRTNMKLPGYGNNVVNIYIPTVIAKRLLSNVHLLIQHPIAQDRELVDEDQGLTSFLASLAPDGAELVVTIYTLLTEPEKRVCRESLLIGSIRYHWLPCSLLQQVMRQLGL